MSGYFIDKQKVKQLMTQKGITTQTELADMLGITKNQLSVILSNKFNPIKSTVQKLGAILDANIVDIICENEQLELELELSGTGINSNLDLNDSSESEFVDTKNITPENIYNVLELFAGAGGLALGLEKAGFNEVGLVEIDKYAAETLRLNRPTWNVIEEDIIKVSEQGIYQYLPENVEIDLISGGYPCQAFSYAGKRLGLEDTRGTLFYNYAKILEQVMPKMFLVENVKGLTTHDNGRTLQSMIDVFEQIGYRCTYKVLNALDYGVAQKRQRMILVGIRSDLDINYKFPKPYEYQLALKDILKDVPDSPGIPYSEKKRKIMELVPPGGYWRDLPDEIAKEYMGVSYYSGGGRTGMARRISWDEPSLTVTTSPSQKQTERCHPDETRPFTTREYARIQSFPDDWEFFGGTNQIYKQIGNAVAVNFAKEVGLSLINSLNQL